MTSTPDDIDLRIPFGSINVNSVGNSQIDIICITDNLEVKYSFSSFHGYENRSEFFDRKDGKDYNLKTLPNTGFCFPISYIKYEDFKNELSEYELVNITHHTKLWRFLSLTNFVELYSSDVPVKEITVTA